LVFDVNAGSAGGKRVIVINVMLMLIVGVSELFFERPLLNFGLYLLLLILLLIQIKRLPSEDVRDDTSAVSSAADNRWFSADGRPGKRAEQTVKGTVGLKVRYLNRNQ